MVAAILGTDALLTVELFSRDGSWQALAVKIPLGGIVFCGALVGLWRLEGRPAGIERRILELLAR
jgi:hypothetical protein